MKLLLALGGLTAAAFFAPSAVAQDDGEYYIVLSTCATDPKYCSTPEERAQSEKNIAAKQAAEMARRAADAAEKARKAAELKKITDQIGTHRAAEAEKMLRLKKAAENAKPPASTKPPIDYSHCKNPDVSCAIER